MANSPNYSWSEPDNTSLVKDGAQAMRTLGDAIDTSVWNIGFGQAGKNKIINGDFGIWQRGTSGFGFGAAFNADRWAFYRDGSGATEAITQQTFTPGAAPVAGYEGQYFWRYAATVAGTGATERSLYTKMEDVRTYAGQPVTLSFWAKADAARTLSLLLIQNFGSGGSAQVTTTLTSQAVTTSWARYSVSTTLPSISGKTVGTSSYLQLTFGLPVNVVETIDLWGVQLEYGLKMTPFQPAGGGSKQAELAMCQRYTQVFNATNWRGFTGQAISSSRVFAPITLPVQMRTSPTVTFSAAGDFNNNDATGNGRAVVTATTESSRAANVVLDMTSTGVFLVPGYAVNVTNANANAVITISAEL